MILKCLRTLATLAIVAACSLPAWSVEPTTSGELDSCRRAIEEVYWRARTWPAGNPQPKPPLSYVLTDARLSERVDDSLRMSAALETLARSPITAQQIQAEMDRMARETRDPAMLREIWAALGNDPDAVAECLVRPILAERLLRSWYDGTKAGTSTVDMDTWWQDAKRTVSPVATTRADGTAFSLPAIEETFCSDDSWRATRFEPDARAGHVAVWTGAEMVVWGGGFLDVNAPVPGGRYDPATDTWRPINMTNPPTGRSNATGLWTGTELIVWGGWGGGTTANVKNTGGRYAPTSDSWTPTTTTGAPSARSAHSAVWSGAEMIVWGGCPNQFGFCDPAMQTGGRYDPSTDSWHPVSTAGAPAARGGHTAVWTGSQMVIWGGYPTTNATRVATGGRYNPVSDTWLPTTMAGAPEGRDQHTVTWTGTQMIVWGGCPSNLCFTSLATGGRYDPAANSWQPVTATNAPAKRRQHSAVWTGTKLIVWGGCLDSECTSQAGTGGIYDPTSDAWTATSTTNAAVARAFHTAVWSGSEMIVFGGCLGGECQIEINSGSRYNPSTNSWIAMGIQASPSARLNHTAVWTGAETIVWGGFDSLGVTATGRRYDPATDTWSGMTFSNQPLARDKHTAVWTGTEMIVWGGSVAGIGTHNSGARYNPTTDSWVETTFSGAPPARMLQAAVWTGTRMIVWGGCTTEACSNYFSSGGRYDPLTDSWQPTATAGAPQKRAFHRAVWTGSEMIVWGGGMPAIQTGGRYAPATNTWQPTSLTGAPSARLDPAIVWTGTSMIVWGGSGGAALRGDGARYDPPSDSWQPISPTGAPAARFEHTSVWTGTEMIVWGGCADTSCASNLFSGGRYDPAADTWRPTSVGAFTPFDRSNHVAVWTGTEMMVWGGWRINAKTNTGALYCAGGEAGSGSPGDVTGLVLAKNGNGSDLDLAWGASCSAEATDYAVYTGTLGAWYSHTITQCSTGGTVSTTLTPSGGSDYYLVVPLSPTSEGSYGRSSDGTERPRAANACMTTQILASCP